jgi:hypothetical protein
MSAAAEPDMATRYLLTRRRDTRAPGASAEGTPGQTSRDRGWLRAAGQERVRRARSSKREAGLADQAIVAVTAFRDVTPLGFPRLRPGRHSMRAGLRYAREADDGTWYAPESAVDIVQDAERPAQSGHGPAGAPTVPGWPGGRILRGPRWRGCRVVRVRRAVSPSRGCAGAAKITVTVLCREDALAVVLPDVQVQERLVTEAQAAQRAGRVQGC